MRIIENPSIGITAEDLFVLCVNSFRDDDLRSRLLGYTDKVKQHAEENRKRVPTDITDFLDEVLPEQVSKEDMKKVYEEKLVGGNGREYYDKILELAPHGRCPICGVQQASTLDHYLPKSEVPTLAVDPGNLVPACDRCNRKKTDKLSSDPSMMPVHIYYDRIPAGKWLHVELGSKLEAMYYTGGPDISGWESGLRSRVTRHLEIFGLNKVYSIEAANELANLKNAWTIELEELQEEADEPLSHDELRKEFRAFIRKRRKSWERGDENSAESAFYRGIEENMETAYAFFGLREYVYVAK